MSPSTCSLLPLLSVGALACTLVTCGAPASSRAEQANVELGVLRLGRKCEVNGRRYVLDARFDVVGPVNLELDTAAPKDASSWDLPTGPYTITIRSDFSVWRDVAVAQTRVAVELISDERQAFEIHSEAATMVAYDVLIDGQEAATFVAK